MTDRARQLTPPTRRYPYVSDPGAIYRDSFATIRAEADLSRLRPDESVVAVRMIHAAGDTALVDDLELHPRLVEAARGALRAGAPILTDAQMIASGRHPPPAAGRQRGALPAARPADDRARPGLGHHPLRPRPSPCGATTSRARSSRSGTRPRPSSTCSRRSPTAGPVRRRSSASPSGSSGSAESKAALAANPYDLPFLVVHGRRGGSALCVAAINALATEDELA